MLQVGRRRLQSDRNVLVAPDGVELPLEPKVVELLMTLARQPGRVFTRGELIDAVWGVSHGGDESLTRAVSLLRKAFDGEAVVETIPKRGYRLTAPIGALKAAESPDGYAPLGRATKPLLRRRRVWAAAAGVAAVMLTGSAVWPLMARSPPERIAVAFRADNPEFKSMADEIGAQLVGGLSAGDLLVDSRSGRAALASAAPSLAIDGSVRGGGGVTDVRVQITDQDQNLALWSQAYSRSSKDAHLLREQVAAHVTDVVRCALLARRPKAGAVPPLTLSVFLHACDKVRLYEEGPYNLLPAAKRVTEQAPEFADGWSMLAMARAYAAREGPPERARQLAEGARLAARRAQRLDSRNVESWLALAALEPVSAFDERQELVSRALRLDPESAAAHAFQGALWADMGRSADALGAYRRAVALDPTSPNHRAAMITALGSAGRRAEQKALAEHLSRVWPQSRIAWNHRFKSAVFLGDPQDALAILESRTSNPSLEDETAAAWREYLLARQAGSPARINSAIARMSELTERGLLDSAALMVASASVGHGDTAFRAASRYFEDPHASALLLFLPSTESMRRDPRFPMLARRLGLEQHWRKSARWPDACGQAGSKCGSRA